ncbi:hypothetical protein BKP45_13425 [Anaerobacillus alkalidiazotrophicus]|uniref:Zinc-finger domain-containing protein n=1 Tax=Anaerobacillus alkalidiazotrophicus TaxID=472963 RepID=A0A1S2M4L9_9BACI|nr:hypothetical protein [Anaerobacillus alkalidiazotrophicus]OIJ19440.1 hypothetical protein BKP45_13425 [Anaerobacillus alkalidiazotrophicus]
MDHYSRNDLERYAKGELEERQRYEYETHLYTCDHCMCTYMSVLEAIESSLPDIKEESLFTDQIMQKINEDKIGKVAKRPFYEQTFFHYMLAATLTIILMTSGVFQSLTGYIDEVQRTRLSEETPSITNKILETTYIRINNED